VLRKIVIYDLFMARLSHAKGSAYVISDPT
jgi:hypothetical protein